MKPIQKVFEITLEDFDVVSGLFGNSLVQIPAHKSQWMTFNEMKPQFFANNDEQIITGVMIQADILIPRYDKKDGFFHVYFPAKTIKKLHEKFHADELNNTVNLEHNPHNKVEDIFMIESFLVDESKGIKPNHLGHINDGSWIASYKINDKNLWKKIKSGEFNGFSVEGIFNHVLKQEFNNKQKPKNTKMKKSKLRSLIFGEESNAMNSAITTEGIVVFYDGELAEGTAVFIDVDGTMLPAPEGSHLLQEEGITIILDANGIVTEMITATTPEDVEEIIEAIVDEMKALKSEMKAMTEKFSAIELENKSLKEKVQKFASTPAEGSSAPKKHKRTISTESNPMLRRFLKD